MSNYSLRKIRADAALVVATVNHRLPCDLPTGARYAAIWHLERLNSALRRHYIRVAVTKNDPPRDFIVEDVVIHQ